MINESMPPGRGPPASGNDTHLMLPNQEGYQRHDSIRHKQTAEGALSSKYASGELASLNDGLELLFTSDHTHYSSSLEDDSFYGLSSVDVKCASPGLPMKPQKPHEQQDVVTRQLPKANSIINSTRNVISGAVSSPSSPHHPQAIGDHRESHLESHMRPAQNQTSVDKESAETKENCGEEDDYDEPLKQPKKYSGMAQSRKSEGEIAASIPGGSDHLGQSLPAQDHGRSLLKHNPQPRGKPSPTINQSRLAFPPARRQQSQDIHFKGSIPGIQERRQSMSSVEGESHKTTEESASEGASEVISQSAPKVKKQNNQVAALKGELAEQDKQDKQDKTLPCQRRLSLKVPHTTSRLSNSTRGPRKSNCQSNKLSQQTSPT
ncbi:hypothetical protein F5Y19DRAFT_312560 [Xylariaceae sp. FL1651]|nr:hypothetical protein F5Y19DRAFT_312560 [Xylariaceae sp. FL1651]